MKPVHDLGDPAELTALYAAGALPPEERALLEAHLAAGCDTCQDELRQFDHVVTALVTAVEPVSPDPQTRRSLLQRIQSSSAPSSSTTPLRQSLAKTTEAQGQDQWVVQRAEEAAWEATSIPGIRTRILFVDEPRNYFTALVRMEPGAAYPAHVHGGPEECLVLEGELCVGDTVLRKGDYQRAARGSRHGVQSTTTGCLLLVTSSLNDDFTSS